MKEGPDFENRLLKALFLRGEPDRVPLAELGIHRDTKKAFLGGQKRGLTGEIDFWVKAGYDFVPVPIGFQNSVLPYAIQREAEDEQAKAQVSTRKTSSNYSTFSEEETERMWVDESKGAICTHEDFDNYRWPTADDNDYELFDKIGELLPDGMKIIALTGDIMTPVYILMGQENFYTAIYEEPELVEKVFERVGAIQYEVFRRIIQNKHVGAAWIGDDIAYSENLMVSPKFLRQYLFPWFKKMIEHCRELEKPCIFHSDGKLYDVIDDLIDCGFSALHPIEPKAMDIKYVKEKWGSRLCIIGNIDLAYTLTLGTPDEVRAEVKQRIHDIAPGGGYCVSSSNSVTEYVPMANYNAMREAVLEYGKYPISV